MRNDSYALQKQRESKIASNHSILTCHANSSICHDIQATRDKINRQQKKKKRKASKLDPKAKTRDFLPNSWPI